MGQRTAARLRLVPSQGNAATYSGLDRVLIPAKRVVFDGLCRGDYARYLALRSRGALIASRLGLYERSTLAFVRTLVRSGDTVIDVGANFGAYTAALSRMVGVSGSVDAFEPQPDVFAHLVRTLGRSANVNLVQSALGAKVGDGRIRIPTIAGAIPEPALAHLTLEALPTDLAAEGDVDVAVTTLDTHCEGFNSLRYIKVDAEGVDLDVLRGGVETLARLRPFVQFECGDRSELSGFTEFAEKIGYQPPRAIGGENYVMSPK
jgi:FkbM family methyltransferase